jgi:hypothetical protein
MINNSYPSIVKQIDILQRLDDLCKQVNIECKTRLRWEEMLRKSTKKQNEGICRILRSGKIELVKFEDMDVVDKRQASLETFRFFGKTRDQFLDVIVSHVSAGSNLPEHNIKSFKAYSEKVEVDPASPAIKEFVSLQDALNDRRNQSKSYTSFVVLLAESDEDRTS